MPDSMQPLSSRVTKFPPTFAPPTQREGMKGRERETETQTHTERDRHRLDLLWSFETWKPTPSDIRPRMPHFLMLPEQSTNWEPNVQIYSFCCVCRAGEPLIQSATLSILFFLWQLQKRMLWPPSGLSQDTGWEWLFSFSVQQVFLLIQDSPLSRWLGSSLPTTNPFERLI